MERPLQYNVLWNGISANSSEFEKIRSLSIFCRTTRIYKPAQNRIQKLTTGQWWGYRDEEGEGGLTASYMRQRVFVDRPGVREESTKQL